MKKDNILIFNFDAHKPPVFKEAKGKDYVLYGSDKEWKNNYPGYLIDLYNKSPKHNAIVNSKVNYISGRGWIVDDTVTKLEDKVRLSQFINNIGQESMHEATKRLSKDEVLFGGFAMTVVVNKDGKGLTLGHLDFGNIRVGVEEDTYFYTCDWSVKKPELNEDYDTLSLFPWDDTAEKGKTYLIYYKSYRPNLKEYPLPSYLGGIPYVESDGLVSNFVLNNTKSGFVGGTVWNFHNGEPTEDAKNYIEQQIKKRHHNTDNAGQPLMIFDDGADKGVEIIPIAPNGQDERFLALNDQIQQEIFTSHSFSPRLAGIAKDGGLANNADELRVETEFIYNSYIEPNQRIYEQLFNKFAVYLGLPTGLKIERIAPIKAELSEQTLVSVLTRDEIRALAGYKPLEVKESFSFSENEDIWVGLSTMGYADEELEVVSEEYCDYNPFEFAEVGSIDSQIINIVTEYPEIALEEIAAQVGETPSEVQTRINRLVADGILDVTKTKIKVTDKGEDEVTELETVYKYVERPNAPALRGESREFCKNMLRINRNYTAQQIQQISIREFRNVFTKRGGWYTNPTTGTKTPFCRHIWQAKTVKKLR